MSRQHVKMDSSVKNKNDESEEFENMLRNIALTAAVGVGVLAMTPLLLNGMGFKKKVEEGSLADLLQKMFLGEEEPKEGGFFDMLKKAGESCDPGHFLNPLVSYLTDHQVPEHVASALTDVWLGKLDPDSSNLAVTRIRNHLRYIRSSDPPLAAVVDLILGRKLTNIQMLETAACVGWRTGRYLNEPGQSSTSRMTPDGRSRDGTPRRDLNRYQCDSYGYEY